MSLDTLVTSLGPALDDRSVVSVWFESGRLNVARLNLGPSLRVTRAQEIAEWSEWPPTTWQDDRGQRRWDDATITTLHTLWRNELVPDWTDPSYVQEVWQAQPAESLADMRSRYRDGSPQTRQELRDHIVYVCGLSATQADTLLLSANTPPAGIRLDLALRPPVLGVVEMFEVVPVPETDPQRWVRKST